MHHSTAFTTEVSYRAILASCLAEGCNMVPYAIQQGPALKSESIAQNILLPHLFHFQTRRFQHLSVFLLVQRIPFTQALKRSRR